MKPSHRKTLDQKKLSVFVSNAEKRTNYRRQSQTESDHSNLNINKRAANQSKLNVGDETSNGDNCAITCSSSSKISVQNEEEFTLGWNYTETIPSFTTTSPTIVLSKATVDTEMVNNLKTKMSKSELQESRRKAASRLTAKRRELRMKSLQELENKRQDCTLHRVKWRTNAKGKRSEELDRQVDKFILRDVILHNPKALAFADQHDFDCVTGRFDETVWGDLLSGLELPIHNRNSELGREDECMHPRISDQILNSVGLLSGTKLTQRNKFEDVDEEPVRTPVERTFYQKSLPSSLANRSASSSGKNNEVHRSILSAEKAELNYVSLADFTNSQTDDILADQQIRSKAANLKSKQLKGTDGISSCSEPRRKVNLFSRFVPPEKGRCEDRSLSGELRSMALSSHNPLQSSGDDASFNGDKTHSVRLADSVFLVGPSAEDIDNLVSQYLAEGCGSGGGGGGDTYQASSTKSIHAHRTSTKHSEKSSGLFYTGPTSSSCSASFEKNLEPKLLYLSNKDPEVEDEVLPFFCFPRYVRIYSSSMLIFHLFIILF